MATAPATSSDVTPGWREAEARATPEHSGLTIWLDEEKTVPMFFREIPPGEFRMGARATCFEEGPAARVQITQSFFAGTFPVTQTQYKHSKKLKPEEGAANHPAERIRRRDALGFIDWLAENAVGIPEGFRPDLPSEARWEYFCRAGTDTEYYSGDGREALATAGWFLDNSDYTTHPVGALLSNSWGLYDLHGNVSEWCQDVWDSAALRSYTQLRGERSLTLDEIDFDDLEVFGELNYEGSDCGYVVRGGSCDDEASLCRSCSREIGETSTEIPWLLRERSGIRVVLVPESVTNDKRESEEASPSEEKWERARLPHQNTKDSER